MSIDMTTSTLQPYLTYYLFNMVILSKSGYIFELNYRSDQAQFTGSDKIKNNSTNEGDVNVYENKSRNYIIISDN